MCKEECGQNSDVEKQKEFEARLEAINRYMSVRVYAATPVPTSTEQGPPEVRVCVHMRACLIVSFAPLGVHTPSGCPYRDSRLSRLYAYMTAIICS